VQEVKGVKTSKEDKVCHQKEHRNGFPKKKGCVAATTSYRPRPKGEPGNGGQKGNLDTKAKGNWGKPKKERGTQGKELGGPPTGFKGGTEE